MPPERRSGHYISIHALREEGDASSCSARIFSAISIHALREEGDQRALVLARGMSDISIHALREEGDAHSQILLPAVLYFYPRPPRGGRQNGIIQICALDDFYPRPPRGGRRSTVPSIPFHSSISIHALREEGDSPFSYRAGGYRTISIHALREEGDIRHCSLLCPKPYFYPRPPRGGRRRWRRHSPELTRFLTTPSARRATKELYLTGTSTDISIHALREEGDYSLPTAKERPYQFLSTPSARRAT